MHARTSRAPPEAPHCTALPRVHACRACVRALARAGPVVLRELSPKRHGLAPRGPDQFLRRGQGLELRMRNHLKDFLSTNPVDRWVLAARVYGPAAAAV